MRVRNVIRIEALYLHRSNNGRPAGRVRVEVNEARIFLLAPIGGTKFGVQFNLMGANGGGRRGIKKIEGGETSKDHRSVFSGSCE